MEFKLQDLALMATDIHYFPALGLAVNKLLSSRSKVEYDAVLKEATQIAIGYKDVEIYTKQECKDYGVSTYLPGMPLWQPLTLEAEINGATKSMLLESAVVELTRSKNIVTTVVQGRDTSVDEFINNGDWEISVSGMLCTNEPCYPFEEVVDFQEFMNLNHSIKVTHEVMNALGIHEIIVLSQTFNKTPHWNIQAYNFTAKSTQALPLMLEFMSYEL